MSGFGRIRHGFRHGFTASMPPLGLFCLFAAFGLNAASAADDDDRPLDVFIDLRAGANVPEDYAVVFCARGIDVVDDKSLVGHAYIIWSKSDDKLRACTAHAHGFFPDNNGDGLKSVFREVPGTTSDSVLRNKPGSGECRIVVRVTKPQWEATERIRAEWSDKKYRLTKSDCVTFTAAVAEKLNLKLPNRKGLDNFPARFIGKLAKENKP